MWDCVESWKQQAVERNEGWETAVENVCCRCSGWLTQSCVSLRDGDHYDALRDCLKAISLNPCHLKAHFRLARCLFELKYVAEALECLDDFKGKFPEQAHSSACDALDRDINAALFSKSDNGECCCCWASPRLH